MFFKKKEIKAPVLFEENPENLSVTDLSILIHDGERSFPAINDVDFSIKRGEIVGLVGESGCGKSLTSMAVIGLLRNTAEVKNGTIYLGKNNLLELTEDEMCHLRGNNISMIFQDPMSSLNPLMTIGDQIAEAYKIHHKDASSEEMKEKTLEMMQKVGLHNVENLYKEYPHRMSGGMKQRVMIAIALINKPDLIIADEPTTALDVTIQAQILNLLKELNTEFHSMILLISHDLGVVKSICDRTLVMYGGYIVEEGRTEAILSSPKHPYTRGLLSSIPSKKNKGRDLPFIPGVVEALEERDNVGCPFAGRCAYKMEICQKSCPELISFNDVMVRCFRAGGEGFGK